MTETPKIAGTAPIPVEVTAGKTYWWCACGQSARQPFCDGSHKGTAFTPVKHEATEDRTLWFSACKQSARAPLCDGTHKRLAGA
jgi:CDGSH-type Zn-finger protein